MDLMFDEDVDEVGSDIEAYCPKCRADTTHVVITKYEDEIRRVQCNPCGDVHSFRKPRGELDEEPPEPLAVRRRQQLKKPTWEEFFGEARVPPRPYSFRETYEESDVVDHPKFGVGFVSEILSDDKVELTFRDERRILVHNRKDLSEGQLIKAKRKAAKQLGSQGRRAAILANPRSAMQPTVTHPGRSAKAGRGGRAAAKVVQPAVPVRPVVPVRQTAVARPVAPTRQPMPARPAPAAPARPVAAARPAALARAAAPPQ
ncbi:MAG: hypothetical protein HY906_14725, partial [Deltaproteobacteria bacterium]|nr:hypothetical protein [Deltaproteobacteria bacterium]